MNKCPHSTWVHPKLSCALFGHSVLEVFVLKYWKENHWNSNSSISCNWGLETILILRVRVRPTYLCMTFWLYNSNSASQHQNVCERVWWNFSCSRCKQVTPSQMFSGYCLMIVQIVTSEHFMIKSPLEHARPWSCGCSYKQVKSLTDGQPSLSARSWDNNHWTFVMESPVWFKQPQGHGCACSRRLSH